MNTIITLAGIDSAQLETTDAARLRRDGLIKEAALVLRVADAEGAKVAAVTLQNVAGFTRAIEAARVEVKAPVIELGKRIDALAKELTDAVAAEGQRLSKLLGAYQAEEKRKADEIKAKALAEEKRLWDEAQDVERKKKEEADRIAKAEELKAKAEAAALEAKAARARTEAGKAKALEEAERSRFNAELAAGERAKKEEAERKERLETAGRQMVAARTEGMTVQASSPAGVSTRQEICFEVTDIVALHGAAPYLVTMAPNNAAIKTALKGMPKDAKLPGVRHWLETKTHAR